MMAEMTTTLAPIADRAAPAATAGYYYPEEVGMS